MSHKKSQSMHDRIWTTIIGLVILGVVGGALIWFAYFLLTGTPQR